MLRGAKVKAHDPVALHRAKQAVPEQGIVFCEDIASTLRDCDAVMLVTEWPQYQELDWNTLGATMRRKVVFDGRHFLDRQRLESAGMKLLRMHGDVQ